MKGRDVILLLLVSVLLNVLLELSRTSPPPVVKISQLELDIAKRYCGTVYYYTIIHQEVLSVTCIDGKTLKVTK